ncbi:hypothetical protein [Enterococcus sp. CSURQ0835]|uniref:hypothetical protein n=1 Tax=Enterococcus sp. CSURQ0835 TaxID=2681394 RepID=UPI00135C4272|nr:hypothetical protein [Enterococcus sp. CSURQ0835]
MKKLVGIVVVCLMCFILGTPKAQAAGAIRADEQRIIDALRTPVTISGKTFYVPETQITQAENHLKNEELTAAQIETAVTNIQAAISLLSAQSIDVSNINSIEELVEALPRDVIAQIQGYVTKAADALGLVVTSWNGGFAQLSKKATGGNAGNSASQKPSVVYSSANAIKQTGVNYFGSFVIIGALLTLAAGAFVVGRKTRLA